MSGGLFVTARGRLAKDPRGLTLTYGSGAGTRMANVNLAVQVEDSSRDAGPGAERTFWLRLIAFGENATLLEEHRKGETVSVGGLVRYSAFQGRDGVRRESWECKVDSLASHRTAHLQAMARPLDPDEEEQAYLDAYALKARLEAMMMGDKAKADALDDG